jgi:hypothetical protein
MASLLRMAVGIALAGSAALLLAAPGGRSRLGDLEAQLAGAQPPPVAVVIVSDPALVGAVRRAVDPERVVASQRDGIALREGRVLAMSHAAASALIAKAGWSRRAVQIGLASRRPARAAAPLPSWVPQPAWLARGGLPLSPGWSGWALGAIGLLGLLLATSGSRALCRELSWRHQFAPFEPPVVLLPLADAQAVDALRREIPQARIRAEIEGGFALEGDWIVSCDPRGSATLLRRAGWKHRILDIHHPDPFGSNTARAPSELWELEPEDEERARCFTPQQALCVLTRSERWIAAREPIDLPPEEPGDAAWHELAGA